MTGSFPIPTEGSAAVSSRVESIRIGARLTVAAAVAGTAYAAATWDRPHRAAVVAMLALAVACGFAPLAAGAERVVNSRRREPLLFAWALLAIALITGLVILDGGTSSPLALLFFLPVVFVALSYPQRSVTAIGTINVGALLLAGLATGSPQTTLAFYATCLTIVALLCAWEALDHERQRAALAAASRADGLTGCLNRRGFEERLEAEIDACRRNGRRAALVMLDLDDFKLVNDTRGHAAGDELLRWTTARASEVLRPMDSLGRIGGDEFAALIPGAGAAEGREVAMRLRDALGERVSVSIGVAAFPIDGSSPDALHRHADHNLYSAKHDRADDTGPTTTELAWAAALARTVDLRTVEADEHAGTVARYAAGIAQGIGWSGSDLALLRMAALLNDVGKVSVPDSILHKRGPLTDTEFEAVKSHSAAGAEIVGQVGGLSPAVDWIRHSHEHVDGSGYPDGLCGDDIPLASRILLVAEAFDAMTSPRPYGRPFSAEDAIAELWDNAGAQFDPRCVAALEAHVTGSPAGAPIAVA
jgi:diguanylate cyclase (GGDEF)-like protein